MEHSHIGNVPNYDWNYEILKYIKVTFWYKVMDKLIIKWEFEGAEFYNRIQWIVKTYLFRIQIILSPPYAAIDIFAKNVLYLSSWHETIQWYSSNAKVYIANVFRYSVNIFRYIKNVEFA